MQTLIKWIAQRHFKNTEAKYPERNVRPSNLFRHFFQSAMRIDKDNDIFCSSFFDELAKVAESHGEKARFMFVSSIVTGFLLLSFGFGNPVVITIANLSLTT